MDGEKSTLEKVTETVKEAMETIVEGAKSMVSPESGTPINMPHNESGAEIERAAKMKKRPAKKAPIPDPERVAGTTNEQVYIPAATDAAATPAPLFPARKQKRSASPATASKRVAKAKKAAPKTSKKNAKKSAKETAKKAKKTTGKKSASKKPAKTSKKKTSKRRR
jgi:hypothetical protein